MGKAKAPLKPTSNGDSASTGRDPHTGRFVKGWRGGPGSIKGSRRGMRSLQAQFGEIAEHLVDSGLLVTYAEWLMRQGHPGVKMLLEWLDPHVRDLNKRFEVLDVDCTIRVGTPRMDFPPGFDKPDEAGDAP